MPFYHIGAIAKARSRTACETVGAVQSETLLPSFKETKHSIQNPVYLFGIEVYKQLEARGAI